MKLLTLQSKSAALLHILNIAIDHILEYIPKTKSFHAIDGIKDPLNDPISKEKVAQWIECLTEIDERLKQYAYLKKKWFKM